LDYVDYALEALLLKENCLELLKQAGSELAESMNYQVADFITRIKNAGLARRKKISMPSYNINKAIGKVLVKEGFLEEIKENIVEGKKILVASLKYEKRIPVLIDLLLVSKPSLRIYVTSKDIPELQKRGRYTIILSTNKGIMTARQAYKSGIGGEVLFKVW